MFLPRSIMAASEIPSDTRGRGRDRGIEKNVRMCERERGGIFRKEQIQ